MSWHCVQVISVIKIKLIIVVIVNEETQKPNGGQKILPKETHARALEICNAATTRAIVSLKEFLVRIRNADVFANKLHVLSETLIL